MNKSTTNINKGIVIRTEGGSKIGMGHIMRSLSIAHMIRERGIPVSFIVNQDKSALDAVTSAGYIAETNIDGFYKDTSIAAVIFDLKKDVSDEIRNFRNRNIKVVMIDNRTSAARTADLVIIPSLNKVPYSENNNFNPHLLEGLEYFPLNNKFIETRDFCTKSSGSRLRILVTMGGADPNNLTAKVLKALQGMKGIDLNVVIGPSMGKSKELMEFNKNGNFVFQPNVKTMALLMCDTDIAFTAYGITLFELAYMGVPSIVIANYRKDKEDMAVFKETEAGIPLGYYEDVTNENIRNKVASFLHNRELLKKMSKRGRTLIDGYGAERIIKAIEYLGLEYANKL